MKKLLLLFAIFSFLGLHAFAQRTVTGTVTDDAGSSLPGVSVLVKGTTIGSMTLANGSYTIEAPEGSNILIFSYIGMESQELEISGDVMNVTLKPSSEDIEEVIVVAYGVQRKEAGTGSVGVLKSDEFESIPVTSPDKLLQGKIAGVQLNNTTGQPGASTQIRIRGNTSITAGNEPLFVVDGVPVMSGDYGYFASTGNILSSMNPNDIESITILKDASAASIYGSRAANGVILITTKSGQKGKTQFNLRAKYGMTQIANENNYRMMNGEEAYTYVRDGILNFNELGGAIDLATYRDGFFESETLPGTVETVDWFDLATRTGKSQEYEFSVNSGNDKSRVFMSGSYFDQEGAMIETGLKRYSFRLNYDTQLKDYLSIGTRLNLSYTDLQDRPNDALYFVNPLAASSWQYPWELPYNDDGSFNFDIPTSSNSNFLASAEHDFDRDKTYKNFGTVYIEFEPIKSLKFKTQNSIEYAFQEGARWWDPQGSAEGSEGGTLQENRDKYYRITTTNTVRYSKAFADVHYFDILVGQEAFKYQYQSIYSAAWNLGYKIPNFQSATDAESSVGYTNSEQTFMSYFGELNYRFGERYMAKVTYRRDGNSRFGENVKYANFYAVGASWNIHRENFLSGVPIIDMLKLRASYGISGNDGIGNYTKFGNYTAAAYNGISGFRASQLGNPDLTWELNTSYNIGLDFALFKRVDGSFEYYKRTSSDLLLEVAISQTAGFGTQTLNVGKLTNTGFELTLDFAVIKKPLSLNLRLNAAYNDTEIIDLGDEEEYLFTSYLHHKVGGDFMEYYVKDWVGVNPVNGMPLWRNEAGEITEDANEAGDIYAGSVEPKYLGGFGLDLSWKGISFASSFDFKTGHYVYNREKRYLVGDGKYDMNSSAEALDYWKEPGDIVAYPKPIYGNPSQSSTLYSTRFLQKGDYLRIKDITLAYTLPTKIISKAKLNNVRIYASATNVYTWHDVDYWDPERGVTGYGALPYPQQKSIIFGIDLGF